MKKRLFVIVSVMTCLSLQVQADGINEYIEGDTSRVYDLDEVIVVSQPKESFRLRQQALSSSMFSQDEMKQLGIRDLRELSNYTPSFVMPEYGSRFTSSMYIRGIGARINNPSVGMYIDGMPIVSKSAFNVHTYQLDRVDVLRGPQGTLYGQNTEGGLVRMYSRNPMSYQGTDVNLSIGTAFYRNIEMAHYNKVNDQVAFSLSGFYNGQNGFFTNKTTGDKADRINEAGGKFRLVYQPTDRLTFDYIADYQYVRQNGFPYGQLNIEDNTTDDPSTNRQGNYRRNIFNTALSTTYQANAFDVNYTASYQYLKDYMLMDIDYLPQDYMHMEERQFQNATTHELVFKGTRPSRWHWTLGAYGAFQKMKTEAPVYFDPEMNAFLSKTITDYAYYGMLNSMAARMGEAAAAALIARAGGCNIDMQVATIPGLFRTPMTNLAVFHQSDFDITDRLTAMIGLRYDYSYTSIDYKTSALATLSEYVMGVHVDASVSSMLNHEENSHFDQLLPKFGLTYKLNGGSNIYATVTKGYRAGGFNFQMFSDILQTELQSSAQSARGEYVVEHDEQAYDNIRETIAYKPETSWNYEVGTHLNLFINQLQLDFAAYYMQIRNQQLSVFAGTYGFGRMMVNAGKSYSCGIEMSLRGKNLDNHLSWAVNYGITHTAFKEYNDTIDGQLISYKDNKVPFVPMHTFSGMADYRIDLGGTVKALTLGVNLHAMGKTYWDEANTYSQKLYAVLGAHAALDCGNVNINLWGRNLTGTKYNTFAFDSAASGTKYYFAQQGNPFQMGIDVNIHF
ncbi:MAG: TonB-dependent receptor [Prevotella sp.]|nr:TonB-dependent receptor [Prevotella sp.]